MGLKHPGTIIAGWRIAGNKHDIGMKGMSLNTKATLDGDQLTSWSQQDLRRILLKTVADLPDSYRVVVEMRYLQEIDAPTIAATLAVKPATIRKRIERGIDRVRTGLQKNKEFPKYFTCCWPLVYG